jgi:hypothetical protein
MNKLFFLFSLILLATTAKTQNVVFSFSVMNVGATSTVSIYARSTSSSGNNMLGFASYLYYDNTKATVAGFNSTPITGSPYNWGTANESSILFQSETNPSVPITHTGYFFYQNFDNNFIGINLPTTPVLLLTVTFNIISGNGGNVFLAGTSQVPALAYTDNAFNGYPVVVTGTQSQPLPIDLLYLMARPEYNKHTQITWVTEHEMEVATFTIERSADNQNWTSIAKVESKGIGTSEETYTVMDKDVYTENSKQTLFYYRLLIENKDNSKEYSPIRKVIFKPIGQGINVYPNPVNSVLNIELDQPIESPVTIYLYDLAGRQVLEQRIPEISKYTLNIKDKVSAGTYTLSLYSDEGKMIGVTTIIVSEN